MTHSPSSAASDVADPTRLAAIEAALDAATKFDDRCPPHLAEAIRYALLAPGKRLRPQLVLMAAEACGGDAAAAMPAAVAVEMIHAYSLVHDDLP
ncbi:MAG: polyprenyl synthetase family protein, partial [Planctomycetales bacterium]|nr:polyprenyl synthetase family protein [Planctomycetales bacterium]